MKSPKYIRLFLVCLSLFISVDSFSCQDFSGIYTLESPETNCNEYGGPGHPGTGFDQPAYGITLRTQGQLEIVQHGCDSLDIISTNGTGEVTEKKNIPIKKNIKKKLPDSDSKTVVENVVMLTGNQLSFNERIISFSEASIIINNLYFMIDNKSQTIARTETKVCGFGSIIFEQKLCTDDLGLTCTLTKR